jgi:hypothetical protein
VPEARNPTHRDGGLFLHGRLPNLGPHHIVGDVRLERQPVSEAVPHGRVGDAGGSRKHGSQELHPPFVAVQVVASGRAIEQIFQIRLGLLQSFTVRRISLGPDEHVGVLSRWKLRHIHVEAVCHKQVT